ncbi:ketose-bisphosphate aldolase [Dipodascopsis uninucleata]
MSEYPYNNLTWQILDAAEKGNYCVAAFNCYNADSVLASIKAAEEMNSPAMIEIFPWSMHFQGPEYVKFVANACHAAKVPISLHMDHCTLEEDVLLGLELPFDSIMVDAASTDNEENIAYVSKIVKLAKEKGMTIEAEMGRISGTEDGIISAKEMEQKFTEPDIAAEFVARTGCHYLAPSFGNIHGPYPEGGPAKCWQLDRFQKIRESISKDTKMVLHGVYPVDEVMVKKAIEIGARKVNINKNLYIPYLNFYKEHVDSLEMTLLSEGSQKAFVEEAKRVLELVGSVGKA